MNILEFEISEPIKLSLLHDVNVSQLDPDFICKLLHIYHTFTFPMGLYCNTNVKFIARARVIPTTQYEIYHPGSKR